MEKSVYIPNHVPILILTSKEYQKMLEIIAKETKGVNWLMAKLTAEQMNKYT